MTDRWATFDCYGTLIDWERGIGDALVSLWPEAGRERLLAHYHAVESRIQAGRDLPYREVLTRALVSVGAIEGEETPADRRSLLADSLPRWPPFAEVPEALAALRERGWRLAILSNTDPDLLAASVEAIGVPVDHRITVAEAGSYKPAAGHWEAFFRRSGADRGRHVHVAASPFHDIAPAARLGLTAVWINRLDEESDLPRAAELPDLRRLPEALDRLVPG